MRNPKGIYEKERSSAVWWIRYADASGRIRREKVGNKGAAIKLYQKRKTEVLQRKKLPEQFRAKAVTFGVIADAALAYSKIHKLSYTHDVYRMAKLKHEFGDRVAETIRPEEIEKWASQQDWTPATANRYRALISLTFRLAIKNGHATENPARLVSHRKESSGRVRWLTADEEKALCTILEARFPHHLPELMFAIHTGLRRGEQYRLTWNCVDLDRKLLTVPLSKNGETRFVSINAAAVVALKTIQARSLGVGRVFRDERGEPLTGPRHWFDPAVKEAKLADFTWHCLRHTFASRLSMAGVGLRTLKELMGHKTISMTCRYAHLMPSHNLAAVEKLCAPSNAQETSTDTRTDTENLSEVGSGQENLLQMIEQ